MSKPFWICVVVLISLGKALADGGDFSLSIVGEAQSNKGQYAREGLPLVFCPVAASRQDYPYIFGTTSDSSFFAVIQETQKKAEKITMDLSSWYGCLQFKIVDGSGKIYSVIRTPAVWSANPLETWTFPSGGMRIIVVDFASGAMVGQTAGWQGLPPAPSVPEIVSVTATFRYYNSEGKAVSVTSKPTDVYLCPK
jgi:hypothetical protein